MHKCNFTSNTGQGPGGAIHLYQLSGQTTVKIRDSEFVNNRVSAIYRNHIFATDVDRSLY